MITELECKLSVFVRFLGECNSKGVPVNFRICGRGPLVTVTEVRIWIVDNISNTIIQ